ncbi:MAG: FixH family protein [Pseudomonadales bacterium]
MSGNLPLDNDNEASPLWYRQFWPWFLIVLPGSVVIASLVTIYIAFYHSDNLVADNYYREGLAINRKLALDRAAAAQNIHVQLEIRNSGELLLSIDPASRLTVVPSLLQLYWQHPTTRSEDFTVLLARGANGAYRAQLEMLPAGRWYITLTPHPGEVAGDSGNEKAALNNATGWQLKSEINIKPATTDAINDLAQFQSFRMLPRCDTDSAGNCQNE